MPAHLLLLASRIRTSELMSSTAPGRVFSPESRRDTMPVALQFSRRLSYAALPQQLPMELVLLVLLSGKVFGSGTR
jgi:hypothetical protein